MAPAYSTRGLRGMIPAAHINYDLAIQGCLASALLLDMIRTTAAP